MGAGALPSRGVCCHRRVLRISAAPASRVELRVLQAWLGPCCLDRVVSVASLFVTTASGGLSEPCFRPSCSPSRSATYRDLGWRTVQVYLPYFAHASHAAPCARSDENVSIAFFDRVR